MPRAALDSLRGSLPPAAPAATTAELARELADLLDLLEEHEPDAARHAREVADLAVAIAVELGLPHDERQRIRLGGLLHDVGKLAVPDAILAKPGPLDDGEWSLMRDHPGAGEAVLDSILRGDDDTPQTWAGTVLTIVRSHHERWDGGGYPDRLAAREIPLAARIVAVADAFHAMIENRPYREARSREDALAEVVRENGRQFDPDLVASLLAVARA